LKAVSIRVQQERDFFKNIIAWDYEVKLPLVCEKFTSSIPGCLERKANQSLSVTPVEPRGLVRHSFLAAVFMAEWRA
jgi:hypothetical protein